MSITPSPAPGPAPIDSGLYYGGHGTFVPVAAMEAMLAKRCEQIFTFGHTLEKDAARPLREFAVDLKSMASAILEDVQFHKPPDQIERHTIKLGAMALAMFDRLQSERAAREGEE